jgi:hypothetical protein
MRRYSGEPSVPTDDTEAFIAIARQQIVNARIKLAVEPLTPVDEASLWQVIECIESLVRMRSQCFQSELEQIDRDIERHFRKRGPEDDPLP